MNSDPPADREDEHAGGTTRVTYWEQVATGLWDV